MRFIFMSLKRYLRAINANNFLNKKIVENIF